MCYFINNQIVGECFLTVSFKKRILFVGMPDMAIICMMKLVEEHVNIVAAVPPPKNHGTYKLFCDTAYQLDVPVINFENSLKDEDFLEKIRALDIDLAVVCSYGKLFPKEFLATAKYGFVNVHPSLLPKYRGGNPYSHVIMNGETETGVTLHFMDEQFDTGEIIAQAKVYVYENDTMGTLFNRLNFVSAEMLYDLLVRFEKDVNLPRKPQPKGDFIKAPLLNSNTEDVVINWNNNCDCIDRFIRALNPFINAVTSYRGNFLKIHSATYEKCSVNFEPGTVVSVDKDLSVACKDGIIKISVLQAGTYFIGKASDFIKYSGCTIGEKLE